MLAKEVNSNNLTFGIYYLTGGDVYWSDYVESIFEKKTNDSMSCSIITSLTSIDSIADAINTYSFSQEPNVCIVRDADAKIDEKGHKKLITLLSEGLTDGYLLFSRSSFLSDKEKKLCSKIVCEPLSEYDSLPVVKRLFGGKITDSGVKKLLKFCNNNLSRVEVESRKLLDYTLDAEVTEKDVENLVIDDMDYKIYEFCNNIIGADHKKTQLMVAKLIEMGSSYAMLLASLISHFRRMLHASLSPLSDEELAKIFNIKPFAIKKTRDIKGFSKAQLKKIVDMLVDYELKFKSGMISEKVAFLSAVERLIAKEVNK